MAFGFIGTGSMGRNLIEAFIRSKKMRPSQILIHNRTRDKAEQLTRHFPGIRIMKNNRSLVAESNLFFLCIKPGEFRSVLDEIQDEVRREQIVVSITSPVMIRDLEEWLPAKIAKVIPSISHAVLSGNSLFIPGNRLTITDREELWDLFSGISQPVQIREEHARIASDLASCSPAFFAKLLEQWANAAVNETDIPKETAFILVNQMVQGLSRLLEEGDFTLQSLQERVAVPGGVTREGLHLLEQRVDPVFQELIRLTHTKYEKDIQKVQQSLNTPLHEKR
ncbi:late competence protein ComER [Kroppenstedtia pulmonis]|uniref:Pyrroline-5-carboxylate reductase n=1 Tax=Kroppenstedtia pulmonis TaxID=1380685 RepID=A0A7D3XNJ6_9BACL|nr:late competence protein ComER [Kroppenstedtia pulmonis]QKG84989.1 late competence protein ComER [Kroppenstedtia pulmonis]